MLFSSPVYSQASGSIAGITYSHNRGGMYTRARSTPTDPSSERQQTLRSAMAQLAAYWGASLDAGQRAAWNDYGSNVAMTNKLGQTVFLTGQQHFLRSNVPRLQIEAAVVDDAPTIYDLGSFTQPGLENVFYDSQVFDITFANTDAWASAAGGYCIIYQGKNIGLGRDFYRGPWRLADSIAGAGSPPSSPNETATSYAVAINSRIWCQLRFLQPDGRLSLPVILGPVATDTSV